MQDNGIRRLALNSLGKRQFGVRLQGNEFKRIYTFNGRSNDATVIDAVNLKVLANIALGGKPEIAVSDSAGHVFVNIEDTAELVVIDQASNKVQGRWPLDPCTSATGLAIDTAHQRLFRTRQSKNGRYRYAVASTSCHHPYR
jgi:YVTN family beta-propeller protein